MNRTGHSFSFKFCFKKLINELEDKNIHIYINIRFYWGVDVVRVVTHFYVITDVQEAVHGAACKYCFHGSCKIAPNQLEDIIIHECAGSGVKHKR
jgi:hypothetical protein